MLKFRYSTQRTGHAELFHRVNHKPMSFTRRATVDTHVERFIKAYAQYGEDGPVTVRIYDGMKVIETKIAQPNPELNAARLKDSA